MKLIVDMNLSPKWADFLVGRGHDAAHWSSIGAANASDLEIMSYARSANSIVLTNDLDFSAILAVTHGRKPSVMQIRADDLRPNSIGERVVTALRQMASELEEGVLITIEPSRTRMRVLPLASLE